MPSVVRRVSILSAIVAIAVVFAGCGASKVTQCNEMVKVANQAATVGQEFASLAKSKDAAKAAQSFTGTADKVEKLSKEMQALEIKDETLQGFQGRFVKMYQETTTGLRDAATAFQKKDLPAINKALQKIQASAGQESSLVKEVNGYCSGK
jgi:PBP1b-binding outer membrane lipoprotein LpoB